MTVRKGDWMQVQSGKQFWPMDPRPEEIDIDDIAHALSMQCRYGGHCERFYSVAEHSVHVSRAASPENKLWALLHDSPETYLTDVIRPIKPLLFGYLAIESNLMAVIARKFGLSDVMPKEVKTLDDRILNDEREQIMAPPPAPWVYTGEALGVELQCWMPQRARREFLREFKLIVSGAYAPKARAA